ncbi:hypothetical protein PLCT2_00727 [Planctomycetaceae bacterium]|nr:hypothetical protein PLCT2_00727 [Planctomycetaceae bacterium]
MNEKSLIDQRQAALPQGLATEPSVATALEGIQELEQRAQTLASQHAFLERAPREGLLYPSDALKLVEAAKLAELDTLYAELKRDKPWLFARRESPANEKLAGYSLEIDRLREAVKRGALSRDVQNFRPIKRAK